MSAYFKEQCTLFKFSKMDTNQDRPVENMTNMLSFSFKVIWMNEWDGGRGSNAEYAAVG